MLRFYDNKKKKKRTNIDEGFISSDQLGSVKTNAELQSLPVFLTKKGYANRHLNLVNAAVGDMLSLATAIRILAEVDEIHE